MRRFADAEEEQMYEKLLAPTRFGPWDLANRVVMPPLTRNRADADCVPNAQAAL